MNIHMVAVRQRDINLVGLLTKSWFYLGVFICVVFVKGPLLNAYAEEAEENPSADLQGRIDQINQQITDENANLDQIQSKSEEVDAQLKILKADSDKLKIEESNLSQKLSAISAQKAELEEELKALDAQAEEVETRSLRRIRAGYMHPPQQALVDLFRVGSSPEFTHLGFYLTAVRSYDRRMLDELQEIRRSQAEKQQDLFAATANQKKVVQDIRLRRETVEKKLLEQNPLIKELRTQRAEREAALTQLRAQLLRFETVLAGLTGGESDHVSAVRGRAKVLEAVTETPAPYSGAGLGAMKGKLHLPVHGVILTPFGKQVTTKTGIAGSSKGLEMAAEKGSEVHAIADGKVIFYGRMPVIGTILILDHGDRYYSLYGRMGRVVANRGDVVGADSSLGTVSDSDSDNRNFYFEIRKNGAPVNPASFLNPKA